MAFESGRRLCLLFEAGAARYGVEATSVVEVSLPDPDGETLRGVLEVKDLSVLLGGSAEARPGLAVVLDVSPTLVVRVRQVVEVADVARSPFFHLPPGLGERLSLLVRGALLHRDRLFLELSADALVHGAGAPGHAPARTVYTLDAPPERALLFESQGAVYALPLSLVLQVIPAGEAFCAIPAQGGAVAGVFAHGQALWPVYSVPGLLGGPALKEPLFILAELAGHHVALCATRVLGVQGAFQAGSTRGEFRAPGAQAAALFLDFQRMFS